ncbi:MAG: hypothetical protein V4736_04250 [Bdellovibrionota bacterium]
MTGRPKIHRRKYLVDKRLQLTLIIYAFYIAICVAFFAFILWKIWLTPGADSNSSMTLLLYSIGGGLTLMLTVFLGFIITNQIAGPLFRMRNEMKRITDGEAPREIFVRKGDLVEPLYFEYNKLVRMLPNFKEPAPKPDSE